LAAAGSATGTAHLLLFLQALLCVAAALCAERLRPAGSSYSAQEWQQLVAAVGVGACALALAAASLLRRGNARAAAAVQQAAVRRGLAAAAGARVPLQPISGVWIKDKAASDSMEPACDAMHLGGLVRTAIK
jgi:hypothetical protein